MLFTSTQFLVFFAIVFFLYLLLAHRWQNRMLLFASWFFYASWDWRFLSLLLASIASTYLCGIKIGSAKAAGRKRFYLIFSIISNLGILSIFKYLDFFFSSLNALFGLFGLSLGLPLFHLILPIGISFYIFQALSYTIDIYRNQMPPTEDFVSYALFISFFPQLVAGPIMRAKALLPQILMPRHLDLENFYDGCYLIIWGFFQKIFIADNLAKIVDPVFFYSGSYNGFNILVAVYAFAFQIYCDFAGYSNIARGLGKCMGFDIMVNFNLPYFSSNPVQFWKRWHISLSSWLKDYLYIPLGGNRRGIAITYRNIAVTMLLGGLWHGANWTFLVWGGYHAGLIIAYKFFKQYFAKISVWWQNLSSNRIFRILNMLVFFHLVCFGWLIFRAGSLSQAYSMAKAILFNFSPVLSKEVFSLIFFIWLLLLAEFIQYRKEDLMAVYRLKFSYKTAFYFLVILLMFFCGVGDEKAFIYFQF